MLNWHLLNSRVTRNLHWSRNNTRSVEREQGRLRCRPFFFRTSKGLLQYVYERKSMYTIQEAEKINEMARMVFNRDGAHTPLIILYKAGKERVVPLGNLMGSLMSKEILSLILKQAVRELEVSGVVIILESWMHIASETALKELKSGKKVVADFPDKQEALLVHAESDDGLEITFLNKIVRAADGKPSLEEAIVMRDPIGGRFGGYFREAEQG